MARKKNLERAIILGLILSASVYGITYAEEISINDFRNSSDSFGNINVDKNTVVIGTGEPDESANSIANKTITVSKDVILKLENLTGHSPYIIGNGDIYITKTENFTGAGIYVNGNITANSLTIENPIVDRNNGKGIYTYGGDVKLNVNYLTIKSNDYGIFTTGDATSDVNINNTLTVKIETNSAHGIVNSGDSNHVNNIIIKSDRENSLVDIFSHTAGLSNNNTGGGIIDIKADTVKVVTDNLYAVRGDHGDITLTAKNNIVSGGTSGVHSGKGDIQVIASENNIISIDDTNEAYRGNYDGYDDGAIYAYQSGDIVITSGNNNIVNSYKTGIHNKGIGKITLTSGDLNNGISTLNDEEDITLSNIIQTGTDGINVESGEVELKAEQGINQIEAGKTGIKVTNGTVNLSAQNNYITANSIGVSVNGNGSIATLDANNNYISAVNEESGDATGIEVEDGATLNLSKKDGYVTENVVVEVIADNGNATGISLNNSALVTDPALKNLTISSISKNADNKTATGVNLENNSNFNAQADDISILAGKDSSIYGSGKAISALGDSTVTLNANNITLGGAVYAEGSKTSVELSGLNNGNAVNDVYSAAVIDKAGDLNGKDQGGMDVVSALYAEEGASINLSGVNNIQTYYDDPSDEHTSERAVWAYQGANITIGGTTNISTSNYEISPENRDIAIAAGTATKLDESDFTDYGKVEIANVNLNYKAGSSINGDILAAYGGVVNITDANAASRDVNGGAGTGIAITGDLLAGNKGKLTVDLGNNGVLIGRADDYGDDELNNGHGSGDENGFYNPAFSSNILHGGEVTLNMGNGSQWSVQGQSWITNLNTKGNVLIDLTNASTEYESNAHALTVRNLNGDANIKMNLNGDRTQSDMLYIGKGNGTYNIELEEIVDVEDMYAEYKNDDSGEGFKFSGLRFATVGKGSDVDFNVTATDKGFNNIIYTVGKDVYGSNVSNHENDAYNNGDGTSLDKPGNAAVEDLLKDAEQAGAATINTNNIMLLANEPDTGENLDNNENHLNYKLIDMQTVRSDAGETMLNMSRANYSNAIYMDRLNKRLGEARYINDDPEEDEGMWVRVRHDRIGKDEAFRSQNTMYELGYDKRQECDNGKRRVGFAVDYMHGDTGYNDIAGKGEIDRYGLWLYDTWTGNKGHYVDYVANGDTCKMILKCTTVKAK